MEVDASTPETVTSEPQEEELTPAPKKRGRPAGSKNKAPDVYTALLDRMTQLEETFKSRPSSTGGTVETPPKPRKPRQPREPREPRQPAPPPPSASDLLMESLHQAREERRQRQLDFYASFLPS